MATLEDEIKDLKEKNNELAQKVQYWKMTAAQKDDEKLGLMKEINELRLKLSRIRNNGTFQATKLDTALQAASEKAISHLVKASAEIAKSMEIAKEYLRERQELDDQSPRWSAIGGTPSAEKSDRVHRVPPTLISGQSIQPVVALSRTILNTSNPRTAARSPNQSQNHSITERAVPMHMLQDVYIPLTRIDLSVYPNQMAENNTSDDSTEDLGLEDDAGRSDGSDGHISEEDDFENSRNRLDAVSEEEVEPEQTPPSKPILTRGSNVQSSSSQEHPVNPLEGPSWLLDTTPTASKDPTPNGVNLEPDSTTPRTSDATPKTESTVQADSPAVRAFSPTVRRRKRTSSPPALATPRQPHYSPRPSNRRNSTSSKILKVLVAKLHLDGSEGESSPPKRVRSPPQHPLVAFDAPSPNGATDSRVIVSETRTLDTDIEMETDHADISSSRCEGRAGQRRRGHSQDHRASEREHSRNVSHDTRDSSALCGRGSGDSDSSAGGADAQSESRARRHRKAVTYKEKPLNRKMRR
ncbi:unnamed protein product [Chrysodeixis includens]|uniref:Shugoshin C-terminal domain-containing protein n=1 Tax=Chrysodeixis includens TaxID=689277 RepID=A0A9P0BUG7_CHRIL|nr:unnamed protein product [Chrysodeixis includens]